MCHGIPCPPFGLEFDALETTHLQVSLHQVPFVVGIEGVEFVSLQALYVSGVALLGLVVIADKLQVIVAWHNAALVKHHGSYRF